MPSSLSITSALLWAAAILASALLGAPLVLTLVVLPTLAGVSVLLLRPRRTPAAPSAHPAPTAPRA